LDELAVAPINRVINNFLVVVCNKLMYLFLNVLDLLLKVHVFDIIVDVLPVRGIRAHSRHAAEKLAHLVNVIYLRSILAQQLAFERFTFIQDLLLLLELHECRHADQELVTVESHRE